MDSYYGFDEWYADRISYQRRVLATMEYRHVCLLDLVALCKPHLKGKAMALEEDARELERSEGRLIHVDDGGAIHSSLNDCIGESCRNLSVESNSTRSLAMLHTIVIFTPKSIVFPSLMGFLPLVLENPTKSSSEASLFVVALFRGGVPPNRPLFELACRKLRGDMGHGLALAAVVSGLPVFEKESRDALRDWSERVMAHGRFVSYGWLLGAWMKKHTAALKPILEETLVRLLVGNHQQQQRSVLVRYFGNWFGVPACDSSDVVEQFLEKYLTSTNEIEIDCSQMSPAELHSVTRAFVKCVVNTDGMGLRQAASVFEWLNAELLPNFVSSEALERKFSQVGGKDGYLDFLESALPKCCYLFSRSRLVDIFCDGIAKFGGGREDHQIFDPFWLERETLYRLIKLEQDMVLQPSVAEFFKKEGSIVPDWLREIVRNVEYRLETWDDMVALCSWATLGLLNRQVEARFYASAEIDVDAGRKFAFQIEGSWRPSAHPKFPLAIQKQAITLILCFKAVSSKIPRDIIWIILNKALRFDEDFSWAINQPVFLGFMKLYFPHLRRHQVVDASE